MLVIYMIVGALAGIMTGLVNISGSVIIVPALAALFLHYASIPATDVMQFAIGTSLATVVITATIALMMGYLSQEKVSWSNVYKMVPGLIAGALMGAIMAHILPSNLLRFLFSLFLLVNSLTILCKLFPYFNHLRSFSFPFLKNNTRDWTLPISCGIGIACSLLGIGGSLMLIPFLLKQDLDMHQAMSTAIACSLISSLVATVCFIITGWFTHLALPWSTGYIYWPAFLGITLTSLLFTLYNLLAVQKLSDKSDNILKMLFAIFLLLLAVTLLFFFKK